MELQSIMTLATLLFKVCCFIDFAGGLFVNAVFRWRYSRIIAPLKIDVVLNGVRAPANEQDLIGKIILIWIQNLPLNLIFYIFITILQKALSSFICFYFNYNTAYILVQGQRFSLVIKDLILVKTCFFFLIKKNKHLLSELSFFFETACKERIPNYFMVDTYCIASGTNKKTYDYVS